ncbi:hypothetical protein AVEN_164009-1 [Araneus ventricosus]|uniref:Uncharacterized protein n=1 Tax=Araneus ventricosus TaxID=182803 RepID=A0A4Y2DA16_ARAVE|nr:hypothetical protein AVEN_164009-1 [Araneus ventricosus]
MEKADHSNPLSITSKDAYPKYLAPSALIHQGQSKTNHQDFTAVRQEDCSSEDGFNRITFMNVYLVHIKSVFEEQTPLYFYGVEV